MMISAPVAQNNNPELKGSLASGKVQFGAHGQYIAYAVHTRLGPSVQWFVEDCDKLDPLTGLPEIIRQDDDFAKAIAGLA